MRKFFNKIELWGMFWGLNIGLTFYDVFGKAWLAILAASLSTCYIILHNTGKEAALKTSVIEPIGDKAKGRYDK